jgi:hypothetical protein
MTDIRYLVASWIAGWLRLENPGLDAAADELHRLACW